MWINERLPNPEVIVEDGSHYGVGFTEIYILCHGVDESAVLVPREVVGQPEDVVGSARSSGEEHDAKAGARAVRASQLPRM